jgi:hypothetical protein
MQEKKPRINKCIDRVFPKNTCLDHVDEGIIGTDTST